MNLGSILATTSFAEPDDAFAAFEEWVWEARGLRLYPAQEEAVLGVALGSNVILATPTGTGKSLVALGAHFIAVGEGRRTVYTAPIGHLGAATSGCPIARAFHVH